MITTVLVMLICGAAAYFLCDFLDIFMSSSNFFEEAKIGASVLFAFAGLIAGIYLNDYLVSVIPADDYRNTETVSICPVKISDENDAYLVVHKDVVHEREEGRQVERVQFLRQVGKTMELVELSYDTKFKKNIIFLPEDFKDKPHAESTQPTKKGFWRYFLSYPKKLTFFVRQVDIKDGKIQKTITYQFVPD